MKKAIIWDLDGTLFDSYDVIVESICLVFQEFGIPASKDALHQYAIRVSIKALFQSAQEEYGVSAEQLQQRYTQISGSKYLDIKTMKYAIDVLRLLESRGVENYVFTHRGKTTVPVLDNLKMTHFFKEIITSQSGFPRKPDPEAIHYLIDKYGLDPSATCYVGDRRLDMECARNAGIFAVLYLPENSIDVSGGVENYTVKDLLDILDVIEKLPE